MKIRVTQECIDKARELLKNPSSRQTKCCPVALALKNAGMPNPVTTSEYYEADDCGSCTMKNPKPLPEKATIFIQAFDRFEEVEPFTFELS